MGDDSALDPAMIQAYRETHYRVDGSREYTLRIGHYSEALQHAHHLHEVTCSAYITAYNPYSVTKTEAENVRLQQALEQELLDRKWVFQRGFGQHPANGWPAEPSVLIFGLNLDAAKELGRRFEQNALVWNGADAVPRLVLLR